jgi:hypothetical protein
MTTWFEVNVRDNSNALSIPPEEVIKNILSRALTEIRGKGNPIEAEIWSNNVPLGSDTANRIYYFSPKAAEITKDWLEEYSAKPCPEPDKASLKKITGADVPGWYPGQG